MPNITMAGSYVEVIIPSGTALSNAFLCSPYLIGQVWVHNSWTQPAALGIFCSNLEHGYYVPLFDDSGEFAQLTYVHMSGYIADFDMQPMIWAKVWSKAPGLRDPADIIQVNDAHILITMK